jgi:flagellin-like hook-associated protein FlgL
VTARLTTSGNGIELVNNGPTGSLPLRIERANSSEAAWDLGLIPAGTDNQNATTPGLPAAGTLLSAGANNDIQFTATAVGDHLNGLAISFVDSGLGAGNETVTYDATAGTLVFDIDTASTTANQVLGLLAGDPVASTLVTGALVATDGTPNDGSGLMSLAATTALAGGEPATVLGTDVNPVEVKGVFSALIRLQSALLSNDLREIERSVALLDEGLLTVNFARSELGVRQQGLDVLQTRLESEDIELRANLSLEIDVDLATAISEMTARQASLEAALRTTAKISQLTLLNFL